MTFTDLWGQTSNEKRGQTKKLCLYHVIIPTKFKQKKISKKKWVQKKKSDPMGPSITFEVILHLMKDLSIYNVSIIFLFFLSKSVHERMC